MQRAPIIMYEQYNSISLQEPKGTNQPYVCRVAEVNQLFECLDIAGASTLQDQYGANTFNSSFTSTIGAPCRNRSYNYESRNRQAGDATHTQTTSAHSPSSRRCAPRGEHDHLGDARFQEAGGAGFEASGAASHIGGRSEEWRRRERSPSTGRPSALHRASPGAARRAAAPEGAVVRTRAERNYAHHPYQAAAGR